MCIAVTITLFLSSVCIAGSSDPVTTYSIHKWGGGLFGLYDYVNVDWTQTSYGWNVDVDCAMPGWLRCRAKGHNYAIYTPEEDKIVAEQLDKLIEYSDQNAFNGITKGNYSSKVAYIDGNSKIKCIFYFQTTWNYVSVDSEKGIADGTITVQVTRRDSF